MTADNNHLITSLGRFVITWSILDLTLDAAIKNHLGVDIHRSAIVTTGLGFERKVSILRALLQLNDPKYAEAIALLGTITTTARRNVMLHGHVWVGDDQLEFVKMDTDKKLSARMVAFKPKEFHELIKSLAVMIDKLQGLVGVTEEDKHAIANIGKSLATNKPKSGKPQTELAPVFCTGR